MTGTTIYYAIEAKRSRVAAEASARTAQENLALLREQYEAQIGLGPQRVREALLSTKHSIQFWKIQLQTMRYTPTSLGRADNLTTDLIPVRDHARFISSELSLLLVDVIANLRNAVSEFEKASRGVVFSAGGPEPYLESADALINVAIAKLDESPSK